MSATFSGLARSKDVVASPPPPPMGFLPKSRATFPATVIWHHEEGLHVFITPLEIGLDLFYYTLHTYQVSPYPPHIAHLSCQANINLC